MSRFDARFELDNIHEGMDEDLQREVGQILPWYVFDRDASVVDDVYDVGSATGGRKWKDPVLVPALSVVNLEDDEIINDRGQYLIDTIRIAINPDALRIAGLHDVVERPHEHANDRVVYEGMVFAVHQVRVRGTLRSGYVVVGVDAQQVKPDELTNDAQFNGSFVPEPIMIVRPNIFTKTYGEYY